MAESSTYRDELVVDRHSARPVAFAVNAPPKPTVEEARDLEVRPWQSRPRPSLPERKYLWKAVSARFPEARVPREFDSGDDTDPGDADVRVSGMSYAARQALRRQRRKPATASVSTPAPLSREEQDQLRRQLFKATDTPPSVRIPRIMDTPRQVRRVTTSALGMPDVTEVRSIPATAVHKAEEAGGDECVNAPSEDLVRRPVCGDESVNAPSEGLVPTPPTDGESVNAPLEGLASRVVSRDECVNAPSEDLGHAAPPPSPRRECKRSARRGPRLFVRHPGPRSASGPGGWCRRGAVRPHGGRYGSWTDRYS